MFYYTTLCHAMLYHSRQYYTTMCQPIMCHAALQYAVLHTTFNNLDVWCATVQFNTELDKLISCSSETQYRKTYYVISCHTMILYIHTILYDTIPYYTISYHSILYFTILQYSMPCYSVLYYIVLYYAVVYYTILQPTIPAMARNTVVCHAISFTML